MIELSFRFTTTSNGDGNADDNTAAPIHVSLFRPDNGTLTDPAEFIPPLDDAALAEIHWYLELYSDWPTVVERDRAQRVEQKLEGWGNALRKRVLTNEAGLRLWQQFVDAPGDKLLTIDATDPRVLRLPWELLADDSGHLFAQSISVRRRLQQATAAPTRPLTLPLRLLVVVARPDDGGFIDPRAVSRPLLAALETLAGQVVVEFLHPPTLAALTSRLRDRRQPPVHLVHFDGHGVYDRQQGLGYLLFEDDNHQGDLVDADQIGTLLQQQRIPLMVLNACQSGKQEEANPYASVAARLIRAGVGSVLAMNYSVLVVAAQKFVAAFYGGLATGATVGQAVDNGRFALLANTNRHTVTRRDEEGNPYEEQVKLRDWFLPALYQRAADPVLFDQTAAPPPPPQPATPAALPGALPAPPNHGFHGRSREMLVLERAFHRYPLVVLHGFGGLGKTTLAAEAGHWFSQTGRFPGGAVFILFEHGGSLAQLCSWVGQRVSGDPNFAVREGDPVANVAALLRDKPALIILDNFESVLGQKPEMPPEEVREVLDAVWQWTGGSVSGKRLSVNGGAYRGSCVLVTTRDTRFNDRRFAPGQGCRHVGLGGLARHDALALAGAVLDTRGIPRERAPRAALETLLERLGGHPLSLNLVLPQLANYTLAELTDQFEALLPGFVDGNAQERNESLLVSLEFSLRRLGEATRQALPDLAVFEGSVFEEYLLLVTEMEAGLWQTARAELEQAALLTAETLPGITTPFLRFHPTLLPYLADQLAPERRAALESRFWQVYYSLSRYLYESDTQNPHEARAIAWREMPNLRRGFGLAVAAGAVEEAVNFAEYIGRFLTVFGRRRELAVLQAEVAKLDLGGEDGRLTQAQFRREDQRGDALLAQGQAAAAQQLWQRLLTRLNHAAYDAAYDIALTQFSLGRAHADQGQPTAALAALRAALAGFQQLAEAGNKDAQEMVGRVYTDIGGNHLSLGQFDEAEQAYENGLKVSREANDYRSVGVKLGQLGTVAMQRGDLATAVTRHREALQTFQRLNEPQMEAVAWHQLGRVFQQARQWEAAEQHYRESLKIEEAQQNWLGVAQTCNQLARVAEGAERPLDAERWYLQAQALKDQFAPQNANTINNLANLYLQLGRLAEAETQARRAVAIDETLDLSAEPWKSYNTLANILLAQGKGAEAVVWRHKEQDSFAQFAGAVYQLPSWAGQVSQAVIAAAQGSPEAQQAVAAFLPQLEEAGRGHFAAALRRILAGERHFAPLRDPLAYDEAYMVRAILQALSP